MLEVETSVLISERLRSGNYPSQILRDLMQTTGLMKNEFAQELAFAFPKQDHLDMIESVWHWHEHEHSEILDRLFDFKLIKKLLLGGEILPWSEYECMTQIQALQPALAEFRNQAKIVAEKAYSFVALKEKIESLSGTVKCIQALWDGDTHGWFVRLTVITFDGVSHFEHLLTTISCGGDIRLFRGEFAPWPEAIKATEVGTQLSQHFATEFYFPNPETPNDDGPGWLAVNCIV